jgi:hypothetical protein
LGVFAYDWQGVQGKPMARIFSLSAFFASSSEIWAYSILRRFEMSRQAVRLGLVFSIVLLPILGRCAAQEPGIHCFNFEMLSLGTTFGVGDVFSVTGADVEVGDLGGYSEPTGGFGAATVEDYGYAGGFKHEMSVNFVNLVFQFHEPVDGLVLLYGQYAGHAYLEVNGDAQSTTLFTEMDGTSLGGVNISIGTADKAQGRIVLEGEVDSFAIGGVELWIDDPCTEEPSPSREACESCQCCVGFDSFRIGATYGVGDIFNEGGIRMLVEPFQWENGSYTSEGVATVDAQGKAGGSENDLLTDNVNIRFNLDRPASMAYLRFGEYGGNLNFEINGEFVNFDDFSELQGAVFGDVTVLVTNGSDDARGVVALVGHIEALMVGGQELWLDDVCFCMMP